MKRREFLGSALAGTTLMMGSGPVRSETPSPPAIDPFELVTLGRSGLKVSRVGIGTGAHGWMRESNQTRLGPERFTALLKGAYDRGVRYFDLADLYGTHGALKPALAAMPREEYVVVSKMWWREGGIPEAERPDADVVVDRFLRELGLEYIDLLLLHCVTEADWPKRLRRQMDLISEAREAGKVRAHGVSVHALPALKAAVHEDWVQAVHTRINPYGVSMDGPADEVVPVLEDLHQAGIGVTGMKLIGNGEFRDDEARKNHSIQYVMGLECVDACVVGFETVAEIDDFAERAKGSSL